MMFEESKRAELLEARVRLLEDLLRQVPEVWARCQEERSFCIREPGSASYEFLKLLCRIEQAVPPIENQAPPP